MAYADKITSMRRMAIIQWNHNIIWEGVNIEGMCLLKKVYDDYIMLKEEGELEDWLERENSHRKWNNQIYLEIKYQDPEHEKRWEPRKEEDKC